MKLSVFDIAIKNLDDKIDALMSAKQHLREAHEALGAPANGDEPKARKTRRKRTVGLPQATPPASEANHLKTGERL